MPAYKDRIEFRVIGTEEQLERAEKLIRDNYDVFYQSDFYGCKDSPDLHRQYYKVTEKKEEVL